MKKVFKILYLVIAVLNIMEYLFISGLFTAPIIMIVIMLVGLINIVLSVKDKMYLDALLYLVSTVALNMGYWKLL